MERYFNITGVCSPKKHYMVRLDERLKTIKESFVDRECYFVISRGRQYGKTTTLRALARYLKQEYLVISMDFQEFGESEFQDGFRFSLAFADRFLSLLRECSDVTSEEIEILEDFLSNRESASMMNLFQKLSKLCELVSKPLVLIIDEVDSASNNQVFLDFLSLLRSYYLNREDAAAFHSVILAGVYDIKNLKRKIRSDDAHKYNSPWNIATDFDLDMSLSAEQIEDMLNEYENDHHTGMDAHWVSREIRRYTGGYPYLVSWLCKWMDEKGGRVFTPEAVTLAVREIHKTTNTLFDDMTKKVDDYPEFAAMLKDMLLDGKEYSYHLSDPVVSMGVMFGIFAQNSGKTVISNIIFETVLYNKFLMERTRRRNTFSYDKSQFLTEDGKLDMEQVLKKFRELMWTEYRREDGSFYEKQGGLLFLCFLKPIINGIGNYYVEPQTRNNTRMDIVVFYERKEYIIELKIWHGEQYRDKGIEQLAGYMDSRNTDEGYLVSFNFNQKKISDIKKMAVQGKTIVEVVI